MRFSALSNQRTEDVAEVGSGYKVETENEETSIATEVDAVVVAKEDTSVKAGEIPWQPSLRHWLVADKMTLRLL